MERDVSEALAAEVAGLRRQVRRMRAALIAAVLGGASVLLVAASSGGDVLRAKGIVIVDDEGRDRILIGAPVPESPTRLRQDSRTPSIVFVDASGTDRVIVGQAPDAMVGGRVARRIGEAHGLTFFDSTGSERGGIAFLDNGRAAVVLDNKERDAIGMMVDDATGFAGLLVNYPPAVGGNAIMLGQRDGAVSLNLSDPAGRERAALRVAGDAPPAWQMTGAAPQEKAAE